MIIGYTPEDEQIVEQLLLETEMDDAADLKHALLDLRSFAVGPSIEPSAEVAALMTAVPLSLDARRRRRHRRTAMVTLAVAASMGLGTAAVAAADPGFREKAQETITTVIDTLTAPGHRSKEAPGHGSKEAPGHVPGHPKPSRGTPEHAGPKTQPSSAPGQGKTGQGETGSENQSSPNAGTPPETPPAKGTVNGPAAPVPQNTGNGSSGSPAEGRRN